MKAYYLTIKDNDDAGIEVVFADTARAAKKLVSGTWIHDNLENYIDLRVCRAKKFDGMESLSAAELAKEQWREGWRWFDLYDMPDEETSTDEEFYRWYNSNFGDAA